MDSGKNICISVSENYYVHSLRPEFDSEIEIWKYRIIASQIVGTLAVIFLKITYGSCMGFTTIFVPELYKENAEIKVTLNELTWFSSYCFMLPVGCVTSGFVAQRIGSRLLLLISAILFFTSLLLFHWATNSAMILCAQAIIGSTEGLTKGPGFTYVAEITQPQFRGTLMATNSMFHMSGLFFTVPLGSYVPWRTIVLVNLIFPIVGFTMMLFVPESPHWLASKDRFHKAELSLAWYRGWTTPKFVKTEFLSLKENWKNSRTLSENVSMDEKIVNSSRISRLKETIKPYLERSFYIPLATVCYIFFINTFGGSHSIAVFAIIIFKKINSPLKEHTATIILSAVRAMGVISCILTVHIAGKRKLMFFSLIGGGISFFIAATFGFLIDHKQFESDVYSWIPTISITIAIFMIAAGIDKIMYLLNSELFPLRLRHVGVGIGLLVCSLMVSMLNKAFLYIANSITLPGTFMVFAITNIVGFVTIYFILPETEGRTLNKIQNHYEGVCNLRNTHRNEKDNATNAYSKEFNATDDEIFTINKSK